MEVYGKFWHAAATLQQLTPNVVLLYDLYALVDLAACVASLPGASGNGARLFLNILLLAALPTYFPSIPLPPLFFCSFLTRYGLVAALPILSLGCLAARGRPVLLPSLYRIALTGGS
jgi:hypothetical protein